MRSLLKITPLLSLALAASVCLAAQPQIDWIEPPGLQRGSEVELVFHGSRLADAQELLFYSPGLTVQELAAVDAARLHVRLAAPPDCRLGMHALRVRTETGISNLLTLAVGALAETAELEPNGDFANPQTVALDTTVTGVVTREDVDYFVVQAKRGERITAELEGLRLGLTFFDPYVAILDQQRFALARSDDSALLQQDPVCSLIAPDDGRYVLQVRDSAFEGDERCHYRLHVGRFPRPRGVLPAGGRPGQMLDVTWLGGPAEPRAARVSLPPADQIQQLQIARAAVFAEDEQGQAPSPNFVRISDLTNVMESEPNKAIAEATVFAAPAALNGVIDTAGDMDRFKFTAQKDARYDVQIFARRVIRSPLDSVLRIRNGNGERLAGNDDTNGLDSYLRFQAPADGEYVIEVQDHRGRGGADFVYRIEVAPVRPRVAVYLPEQERYISTTLVVPRGNRMALMVGARRSDWDGPLQLEFDGLPAGITAQAQPIPPGRSEVPVLFTAVTDAEPAGRLVDIRARPAEGKPEIVGHLQQRTMLVRGQNNRDVWGHDADRMSAVIAKEAPFRLDIVQPKAPLVRNGSLPLKIVATRQEGFQAPIAVKLLYDPPGVASAGTITIAEGKTETVIPLTANGSAAIQRWPIVVVGRAPAASGGQVQVASGMAELDVADHFVELAFGTAAVERGKSTILPIKITQKREFAGTAKVELVGLPPGATSAPLEFDKQAAELAVPIHAAHDARLGRHKTILCRVTVTVQGEPVIHTLGNGELRVDPPLQPKPAQAVAAKTEPPQPKPPQPKPPPKVLSRLELLRQQRKSPDK